VSDITEIVNDIDGVEPLSLDLFSRESLKEYFAKCEPSYIMRSEPRRFLQQRILYNQVSGTECMAVSIDKLNDDDSGKYWIHIALANSLPQVALENASRILFQHKLDVSLSHLDMIADGENGNVCLLSMLVSPVEDAGHEFSEEVLQPIIQELKRTKWLDPRTMDLVFNRHPWLGVTKGEMVTTFCSLLHPIMASRNQYAFSMENIFDSVTGDRYIKYVSAICDLFLERFNPSSPLQNEAFEERYSLLLSQIKDNVDDAGTQELLKKMLEIVRHTLRTNIYLENRYALGLRLDPRLMSSAENSSLPYGVIFVHGRRFNGFHVRFKDIARGGLRLVTPSSPEQHALESGRHYDECYGLAFAQQLKNKDIPEGGSKAVTLINCNDLSNKAKQFVMRKSVKAFTNTILDLVVETKELQSQVVDYLGKKEEIYLGPDEQVTVEDINWIVKRATQRGHNTPNAFMSSKPKGGINHKVYGVTSEGVIIYLDVALRQALNINPHENEFTVKMTGGPDGDVAGNAIKILYREYGDKAKIVGIADSSGCAEDP
jgi:glutamate dehydrogenase